MHIVDNPSANFNSNNLKVKSLELNHAVGQTDRWQIYILHNLVVH